MERCTTSADVTPERRFPDKIPGIKFYTKTQMHRHPLFLHLRYPEKPLSP